MVATGSWGKPRAPQFCWPDPAVPHLCHLSHHARSVQTKAIFWKHKQHLRLACGRREQPWLRCLLSDPSPKSQAVPVPLHLFQKMTQPFSQDTRPAPLLEPRHTGLSSATPSPVVGSVFKAHIMQCLSGKPWAQSPLPSRSAPHPARAALSHPLSQNTTNTERHSSSISST